MENKRKIAIILNVVLVILEIIGLYVCVKKYSFFDFSFYTQDSNLFALIIAIIYLMFLYKNKKMPKVLSILKYISVLSLMVTFLVVIFILSPMYNFAYKFMLLDGASLYYHTLCPIVALISFLFFEAHDIKGFKDNLRAVYFTILYAIISIILNIVGVLKGPYPFLLVRENPIYMSILWFVVIVVGAFGLAKVIEITKHKIEKEN